MSAHYALGEFLTTRPNHALEIQFSLLSVSPVNKNYIESVNRFIEFDLFTLIIISLNCDVYALLCATIW